MTPRPLLKESCHPMPLDRPLKGPPPIFQIPQAPLIRSTPALPGAVLTFSLFLQPFLKGPRH